MMSKRLDDGTRLCSCPRLVPTRGTYLHSYRLLRSMTSRWLVSTQTLKSIHPVYSLRCCARNSPPPPLARSLATAPQTADMSPRDAHPAVRDNATYWRDKYRPNRGGDGHGSGRKIQKPQGAKIALTLNDPCLHLIRNTLSEADSHGFLLANDQDRPQDAQVSVELARFRGWRRNPTDTAVRSLELAAYVAPPHCPTAPRRGQKLTMEPLANL